MADEFEELHKAKPVDSGILETKRRVEYPRRRLKPGEIPDFTVLHHDREGTDFIESQTIVPAYVTDDGRNIDSHTDIAGYCYMSMKEGEEKVSGCGALVTKRCCANPLCDHMMCQHHCQPHPEKPDTLLCQDCHEKLYGSSFGKFLDAITSWLFGSRKKP